MSTSNLDAVFLAQRLPLLRTLVRMVNNPSIAEDLVQETYLRVARTLLERRIDHLEPFLFQTGRNLALDHLRHLRMQSRTLLDDVPTEVLQAVPAPGSSAEDQLHAEHTEEDSLGERGVVVWVGEMGGRRMRGGGGSSHGDVRVGVEV